MKSEPILGFRAPGTRLLGQDERPAARHPFGGGQSTTSLSQRFEMSGEPGDAVEAYRAAAVADGWAFLGDGCSRVERAATASFGKRLGDFDATLMVHARLDRDLATYGEAGPGLVVTLTADRAVAADPSVDVGLHHSTVHCLRNIDLSAADLQPPKPPSLSMDQLCSRIPLSAAKAVAAEVEAVYREPAIDQCWLVNALRVPLFMVEHARQPRAYDEERRLPSAHGSTERFTFSTFGKSDPNLNRSV